MKDVYKAVFEAHQAARQNAKPGATGAEVDAGARNSLVAAGYGEFFTHRTGHGIGSQIHEAPYISNANHEPLKPGDCFSIEPGVYLTGNFGIRIENIVTLTEEGLVSLNAEPSPTIIEV